MDPFLPEKFPFWCELYMFLLKRDSWFLAEKNVVQSVQNVSSMIPLRETTNVANEIQT